MCKSHSQNHTWLNELNHGKVLKVEFEELINSNNWNIYNDKWWEIHCKVINHVENLIDSHVLPSRTIKLLFYFEDGTIMEPNKTFYELITCFIKHVINYLIN